MKLRFTTRAEKPIVPFFQSALKGPLGQDLRLPSDFMAAAEMVTKDDVAEGTVLGPDPEPWREEIASFERSGYTHVYIHQVGPDQEGFLEFARRELLG